MKEILRPLSDENHCPIREQVLAALKEAIFENRLRPGDRLMELPIANALGVSRTPVRDALRQLEREKLAANTPHRGTVVSEISTQQALQIYEIREVLEGLAARLACQNITDTDRMRAEELVCRMEESVQLGELEQVYPHFCEWIQLILQAADNDYLKDSLKEVHRHLGRLHRVSMRTPAQHHLAVKELRAMMDEIHSREAACCEQMARLHVRSAKRRFLETLREEANTTSDPDMVLDGPGN